MDFLNDDENELTQKDMVAFLSAVIDQNGLMQHNINSYSEFLDTGISKILRDHFNIYKLIPNKFKGTNAREKSIVSYEIRMSFSDIKVETPQNASYYKHKTKSTDLDVSQNLFPYDARKNNLPYTGNISITMNISITAIFADKTTDVKEFVVKDVKCGGIPIMVGSSKCNTYNCTQTTLKNKLEDPTDLGGMFIAKGTEWVIDQSENIRYNTPHVYLNMVSSEKARCEFLSQPGGALDNSSQLSVRLMKTDSITLEIKSIRFKNEQVPFYAIYKIFGMDSDKDIVKTILYDIDDTSPNTEYMRNVLYTAFHNNAIHTDNLALTYAEKLLKMDLSKTYEMNPEAKKFIINTFYTHLDSVLLPHMGTTSTSRINKLKFIGMLIRKTMLVHLGVLLESDRDNLSNKRMHGAGISIPKAFKSQFNNTTATSTLNAIIKELSNTSFDNFNQALIMRIVSTSVKPHDMNKALEQCLTTSNKDIVTGNKTMKNRVTANQLERKNPLNTISMLRTMSGSNSSNKTTSRADEMRRVHPSYPGYVCIVQSAESGEKVGLKKQLAITAGICTMGDAVILKDLLKSDITPLNEVDIKNVILMSSVFVNGEWLGCCENVYELRDKYVNLRRSLEIDKYTTIYVDPITADLYFWLDVGRLFRPMIIVYHEDDPFRQYVKFTKAHVKGIFNGKITLDDLVREQVVEYITPEEAENCLFAPSITELNKNKDNLLKQYTHCDVEQALFGFAALMSPYGNHTKPDRTTMATCQLKQAAGFYCFNWPFRYDKNRFFQFNNEMPIVNTFAHRYIPASGSNVIIAYMNYMGENQEDSVVVNVASADRGLFAGLFFRVEFIEQEENWSFEVPDPATTRGYKKNSSYEKLDPETGLIRAGTAVVDGDIIIGIRQKLLKNADSIYTHEDKSFTYNHSEPAVVVESTIAIGANDEKIAIIKMKYYRKLIVGDKMSSRCGNKSIVARCVSESDMPFTECGLTPDLIINPQSFTNRMAIGQIIESLVGNLAAYKGAFIDGTTFLPFDPHKIQEELIKIGMRPNGKKVMRNGVTGEYFDAAIFICPTYEERLQKFVVDDEQYVGRYAPTDPITGQPMSGSTLSAVRQGEMEFWNFNAHGIMHVLKEKSYIDSDGTNIYICRNCQNPAVYNKFIGRYSCSACKELADIEIVPSCRAATVFIEYLNAAGIQVNLGLEPFYF